MKNLSGRPDPVQPRSAPHDPVQLIELLAEMLVDRVADRVARRLADGRSEVDSRRLSTKQLAAYLGVRIETVGELVGEGMPHVLVGKRRRFRVTDVEAWLAARTPAPATKKAEPVDPLEAMGIKLVSGGR